MNKTNFIPYTIQKIKDGICMDKIDEYFDRLQQLIEEANKDGVEIVAYTSHIGEGKNEILVDNGIMIGINIFNKGKYKCISTWKEK